MFLQFAAPLDAAVARMRRMLLEPFDLKTWLVVGFGAWLAFLTDGVGIGTRFNSPAAKIGASGHPVEDGSWWPPAPGELLEVLLGSMALWLAICVGVTILLVCLVLLWVSARGQMIFVHNVLEESAELVAPWKRYRREGNSLFLWKLAFIAVVLTATLIGVGPIVVVAGIDAWAGAMVIGAAILWMGLVVVTALCVRLLLVHFVVPIMARERLTTNEAWRVLVPELRGHAGSFLLYGLFVLAIWVVVAVAIMSLGFLTCCLAFLILILPYVRTVVLLPVHVGMRGLGPEFLSQLGGRFELLAPPALPDTATEPAQS